MFDIQIYLDLPENPCDCIYENYRNKILFNPEIFTHLLKHNHKEEMINIHALHISLYNKYGEDWVNKICFIDNRLKNAQIERKTERICHYKQYSHWRGLHDTRRSGSTIEYQIDNTTQTEHYSTDFLRRKRLFEDVCCDEHRIERRERCNNRAIHRSDVRNCHQERELREEKSEHRSGKNLRKIASLDTLLRTEKRD